VRRSAALSTALVALLTAGVLAGCAGLEQPVQAARNNPAFPAPAPMTTAPAVTPTPSATPPRTARPKPTRKPPIEPAIKPTTTSAWPTATPKPGIEVWQLAAGGTGVVGTGSKGLIRYRVEVEQATGLSPAAVASTVDVTLAHSRGWIQEGWHFQRVSSMTREEAEMTVRVATPATVDKICAQYGVDTGGVVSCRGGTFVMINLNRWNTGIPAYSGQVGQYRHLVINHEVGHRLGHGHKGCPGAGLPAPVMMTQYYGLGGCATNVWPYAEDGTFVN
jgi:hypothetical protein